MVLYVPEKPCKNGVGNILKFLDEIGSFAFREALQIHMDRRRAFSFPEVAAGRFAYYFFGRKIKGVVHNLKRHAEI